MPVPLLDIYRASRPNGLWPLWEPAAPMRDYSGKANDSTGSSSPVFKGGNPCPSQPSGVRLSGTQYVQFPALNFASGNALSLAVWLKLNATGSGAQFFLGKGSSSTIGMSLYVDGSGALVLYDVKAGPADEYLILPNSTLLTSTPFLFVVLTISAADIARIYLNGGLRTFTYEQSPSYTAVTGQTSHVLNARTDAGSFQIGKGSMGNAPDLTYAFAGAWQSELTEAEIKRMFLAGLGYQPPGRFCGRAA